MGKSILAAIFAAILASIVTTLVMTSIADDQAQTVEARLTEAEARADRAETQVATALDRIDRFGSRVQQAERTAGEAQRNAAAAAQASGATPTDTASALVAPDGTTYISRAEIEKLLDERGAIVSEPGQFTPPPPRITLAEAAEKLGLTAAQEASLAVAFRDAQQEMINMVFGNRSIEDVKAELARIEDDPDAQADMVQRALMRGFSNAGKFVTFEKRMRKKVDGILGVDQAQEFRALNVKTVDDGLEDVFEKLFDN